MQKNKKKNKFDCMVSRLYLSLNHAKCITSRFSSTFLSIENNDRGSEREIDCVGEWRMDDEYEMDEIHFEEKEIGTEFKISNLN